jgi:hypothetical protein
LQAGTSQQQQTSVQSLGLAVWLIIARFCCICSKVNVAETETEDQAVKRYMRAVVQSGVINKVGIFGTAAAVVRMLT